MGKGSGSSCPADNGCHCGNPKYTVLDLNRPRGCTDLLVTVLFIGFVIGVAAIAGWSGERGHPGRLLYGADSWGNVCGESNEQLLADNPYSGLDLTDYKHEYRTLDNSDRTLCVRECPSVYIDCGDDQQRCIDSGACINVAGSPYSGSTGGAVQCPSFVYGSEAVALIERCAPTGNSGSNDVNSTGHESAYANSLNNELGFQELVANFYAARWPILSMVIISAAASFGFIGLMRCCSTAIVYTVIGISLVAVWLLAGMLWYYGADEGSKIEQQNEDERTDSELANYYMLMISAGFMTVLALFYFCIVCAMRKRIHKAIGIMEEAAVAFWTMPSLFICPIVTWILVSCWVAVFLVISLYVATSQTVAENPSTSYAEYRNADDLWVVWLYMILSLFWVSQFFIAAMEFCVGSSVVIWYLSRTKPTGIPLKTSLYRLFRYHFGTIAFGSLIIAIIQLIRVIFEYLDHKFKHEMERSCLVRFCVCCVRCCLRCLEHCIRFINKNAYIECAIWGDGFIPSACKALNILLENAALVSVVNGVAWLLVEIIKLSICVSIGFISYLWLRSDSYENEVTMYSFVVAFIILVCYLVVGTFTGMYEIGTEAILICLCEDHVRSVPGQYYASYRLQHFEFGHQHIGGAVDPSKNPYLVSNSKA